MPAPFLETPPNPVDAPKPAKLRSSRFGELDEHELVRLLDTLDDERSRARFRESIYISIFVYLVLGLFLTYGLRILPHQPRIINPLNEQKEHEMTSLQTPSDIARQLHRPAPSAKPTLKPSTPPPPAPPAAKPLPAAPRPQPAPQASTQAPPVQSPQLPQPVRQAPPSLPSIPDAPKAAPNFAGSRSAGDSIREAAQGAAKGRGAGAEYSEGITPSHVGVGTGVDILSDTMGVNFDPYLKRIMRQIYNTWIPLIPEEARPPLNKQGVTQIRFIILPDGKIGGMVLEGSTHDDALNRAAWGSITGVGQFPALPSEFHGPNLELRIHYLVNQKPE